MDYSIGTSVLENWRIVRFLGEGANGKVFEIHKTDHGVTTKSALKVMRVPRSEADIRAAISEGMDQRSVTTYFQGVVDEIVKEIALMAELKSHSAIVSCEDYQVIDHPGEIGWDILIRMELLTALPDYQMNSPLGEADVLRMGRELCGALVLCQKKGMIHRDVKPENIFVSEFGQFKLGDFGVARTVEKTTGGLSKKGTESYMAPEVYLGRPYGGSVDIYSLGLVLYKFLNKGRLPFFPAWPSPITFADRENALSARMQGKAFPHPCDASDSFARVILKACAYDPRERYRTAAEFLEALNQVEIPQNAGKTAASGSFAGTSEIYTDEKTMGMYGGSDAEEKTVGMYGNQDAEDKTVGMYGSSSPEAEEKTVGMYGSSDAEEKTVGMYGSSDVEEKTIGMYGNGSPVAEEKTSEIARNTAASRAESKESVRQPSQLPEEEKPVKKTRKTALWIMAAVAVIVIIAIAVFMQSNKKYQVTVANGSGAGAYKAGEEVTLIAEDRSAEDLEFSGWEVIEGEITLGDAAEECDFLMPKSDVEVAAQYVPKKHYVKVIDGEGEGEYIAGEEVTVHAVNNSKGQQVFAGWEVTKGEVSLSDAASETCSFIMPQSDVEIKCNFENIYQVTVNDGNGGGTYKAGDEVTLTAEDRSAEDLVFTGWEITKGEVSLSDASAETCSFLMPQSDVEIKGIFEKVYQVTVRGGSGSGTYREGEEVTLTAEDRSADDMVFAGWEVAAGSLELPNASAETYSFLMPRSDVKISAVYKKKLQLEWENVIDRLMEPEAWMSIDGKTNYAELSEVDWDTYQANYNLAVWDNAYGGWIMPVLPIKEYVESGDNHVWFGLFDTLDKNVNVMGDYYSMIWIDLYDDKATIEFNPDLAEKDPQHWQKGLYPNCGGIYLGERYDDVLEQLGITEEMLAWLPYYDNEYEYWEYSGYSVGFREDKESSRSIYLKKESKEIDIAYSYDEDISHYYLDNIVLCNKFQK